MKYNGVEQKKSAFWKNLNVDNKSMNFYLDQKQNFVE